MGLSRAMRARSSFFATLLLSLAAVAGCLGEGAPAVEEAAADVASAEENAENGLALEVLPGEVAARPPPSLDRPPQWVTGEWWTVELTDGFTGATYTATRVVAGAQGDDYLVGMPLHAFSNELMVLHLPGFGEVSRADLSFEVHDARFAPLQFPLTDGATWETEFEGRLVTATVSVKDATTAQVELIGQNDRIVVTYDATIGEIRELVADGYASYRVIDHGFGFNETVTVPHMHDLIFQEVRIGPALAAGGPVLGFTPSAPQDVVPVDSTYDRVSFVLVAGTILPDASAPQGLYSEKATAPDGTAYELTVLPTDSAGLKLLFGKHDAPGGDWTFDHVAAGPGIALAEGIAYHVYDVELPSGRVLPSSGEHQHGEGEGHAGVTSVASVPRAVASEWLAARGFA